MAKRHVLRADDWESLFLRLQELVMANSGEDDFREIFKLIVVKLFTEVGAGQDSTFMRRATPNETASFMNELLVRAANRWTGLFDEDRTFKLTDDHLTVCVEILESVDVLESGLEVLDGAFEFLVNRCAKGSKGQFFTPRTVVECCIRVLDPRADEYVLDPACGSGGFLVHALNHIRRREGATSRDNRLWGFDFDNRAVQVAKALQVIAGGEPSNLYQLNSLLVPVTQTTIFSGSSSLLTVEDVVRSRLRNFPGFDVIATNPPFAGEIRERGMLDAYSLAREGRRVERDVLFLERCLGLLRPGGRIAIVLPHNKVGADSWSYVREWLLKSLRVVAVLGLDRNTFLPHTHQKASVIFGVKRERPLRSVPSEDILFLVSDSSGKDSRGSYSVREAAHSSDDTWSRVNHDLLDVVAQVHPLIQTSSRN